MSNAVKKYVSSITTGDIKELAVVFSAAIKVMPPGGNQPNEGVGKASMMLSAVAAVVADFKVVRVYEAGDNWYVVSLEGVIDDTPVQFIDQLHVDTDDFIDHIDIFLRPASLAQSLLGKVTEEIKKRTTV